MVLQVHAVAKSNNGTALPLLHRLHVQILPNIDRQQVREAQGS